MVVRSVIRKYNTIVTFTRKARGGMNTRRDFWLLWLGLMVGVIAGYLWVRQRQAQRRLPAPSATPLPPAPMVRIPTPPVPAEPAPMPAPASAPPGVDAGPQATDDLTAINGIGPAYASALNAIGITTYAQLAQADPDALAAQIDRVTAERIRRDDWIGQAAKLAGF